MSQGSESSASGLELHFLAQDGTSGSGSLSTERHAMKEQLEAVRATLNALVEPVPATAASVMNTPAPRGAAGSTSTPGRAASASGRATAGPPEALFEEIASRLGSIESMYGDIASRLVRMDGRVHANERTVRELQHLSAGAMNETARLVDFVGHRSTAGSVQGTMTPGRHAGLSLSRTPEHAAVAPMGARGLDYVPGASQVQLTSTVQLHASQIHKLIAGLDFLEQHIIRQDSVIDDVQKQIATAVQNRSPSELSLRVHDMSELMNKLRAHLYKVEKRSAGGEASIKEILLRLTALEQRPVPGSATEAHQPVPHGSSASTNPLYGDASSPQRGLSADAAMAAAGLYITRTEFEQMREQLLAEVRGAASVNNEAAPERAGRDSNVNSNELEGLNERVIKLEQELEAAQRDAAAARQAAEAAQSELAAVQAAAATAGAQAAEAGIAEFKEAVNELTSKAYDEQLLALQQRMHTLDEEMRAGQADLREYAASLQSQVQEAVNTEVQETLEAVLGNVKDRMQAESEQMMDALEGIGAQVDSCVRAGQLPDLIANSLSAGEEVLKESLRAELGEMVAASLASEQEALQGMVSSSMAAGEEAVKRVLEAQTEELNAMLQKLAGEVYEIKGAVQKEAAGLREDVQAIQVQRQAEKEGVQIVGRQVVELADRLEVTLAMAEEARTLAQEQGQQLGRCLDADSDIRADVEGLVADQERLKEAYANIILDLGELRTLAGDCAAKAEAAASQAAAAAVAATEARSAAEPANLKGVLEGFFISHNHLTSIFAAREDMARAVEKLEGVFVGTQSHTPTKSVAPLGVTPAVQAPGISSEAAEELSARQAATASLVAELTSRQSDMQSKLDLLLYRWDQAVRHDQLAAVSQATMRLEVQIRQQLASLQQQVELRQKIFTPPAKQPLEQRQRLEQEEKQGVAAAGPATDAAAVVEARAVQVEKSEGVGRVEEDSMEDRLVDLEEQVSLLREAISSEVRATQETATDVMEAVHDLQLMVLELRSEGVGKLMAAMEQQQGQGGAGAAPGDGPAGGEPERTNDDGRSASAEEGAETGRGRDVASGVVAEASAESAEYSFVSPRGWDSPRGSKQKPALAGRINGANGPKADLEEALAAAGSQGAEGSAKATEAVKQVQEVKGTVGQLGKELAELKAQVQAVAAAQSAAAAAAASGRGSAFASPERETPSRLPMLLPMPMSYETYRSPASHSRRTPGRASASGSPSVATGAEAALPAALAQLQEQVAGLSAALAADRASWSSNLEALESKLQGALSSTPAGVAPEAPSVPKAVSLKLVVKGDEQPSVGDASSGAVGDRAVSLRLVFTDDAENDRAAGTSTSSSATGQSDATGASQAAEAAAVAAVAAVAQARAAAEQATAAAAVSRASAQAAEAAAADAQAKAAAIAAAQAALHSGAQAEGSLLHDLASRVVELAGVAASLQGETDTLKAQLETSAPGWTAAAEGWAGAMTRLEVVEATSSAARAAALQAAGSAAEASRAAEGLKEEAAAAAAQAAEGRAMAQGAAAPAESGAAEGETADSGTGAGGAEDGVNVRALLLKVQELQWGLQSMREGMEGMGGALSRVEAQVRHLEGEDVEIEEVAAAGAEDEEGAAGVPRGRQLKALRSVLSRVDRVEGQVQAHDQFIVDLMLQGGETAAPDAPEPAASVEPQAEGQGEEGTAERAGPPSPRRQAALHAALTASAAVEELGRRLEAATAVAAAAQTELHDRLEALEGRLRAGGSGAEQRLSETQQGVAAWLEEAEQKLAASLVRSEEAAGKVDAALASFSQNEVSWNEALASMQEAVEQATGGVSVVAELREELTLGLGEMEGLRLSVADGLVGVKEVEEKVVQELVGFAAKLDALALTTLQQQAAAAEATAAAAGTLPLPALTVDVQGAEQLGAVTARVSELEEALSQQRALGEELREQVRREVEAAQQLLSSELGQKVDAALRDGLGQAAAGAAEVQGAALSALQEEVGRKLTQAQAALEQGLGALREELGAKVGQAEVKANELGQRLEGAQEARQRLEGRFEQLSEQVGRAQRHADFVASAASGRPPSGSDDGSGSWAPLVNSALEAKVGDHGKALHLLRSRLIALQEVVDANREAVTELKGGQGSVAARVELLERAMHAAEQTAAAATAAAAAATPPVAAVDSDSALGGWQGAQPTAANGPGADAAAVAALAAEVSSLAASVASLQPRGMDAAHALEQVTRLAPRMGEAEVKLSDLATRVADLVTVAGGAAADASTLKSSTRGRLRRVEAALRELVRQAADITSIQKPSSKNPFAAIAPAGSNPAVLVLEQRFEALRIALSDCSKVLADDCSKME